jgi:hypothetical protein
MHRTIRGPRAALATVIAGAALLAGAAQALAAHPKHGAHFKGPLALLGVDGYKPMVSFTISGDGRKLLRFQFQTLGCFGAGGFRPGVNPYAGPSAAIDVGTIKVSSSGHFSVQGVAFTYKGGNYTVTTTATVTGSFSKPNRATGTLSYSQNSGVATCHSLAQAFTASA